MPIMAQGPNGEETEKRFNAEIEKGLPFFSIDNVTAPLDDRFHETDHGTGNLLADSSFVVDRTRSGIMAGWRQAVGDDRRGEIATDGSVTVADRTGRPGVAGSDAARLSGEAIACSAASSERWPMARLRHLMTDRDRAKSRRSRRRPRPGWYLWPATRPRSTAIRMNCGRHGLCPLRASADRRRVTNVSPVWLKAPCASFSVKRKSSRTRCGTIWNAATPSSSPRWRKFCVSTARSRS